MMCIALMCLLEGLVPALRSRIAVHLAFTVALRTDPLPIQKHQTDRFLAPVFFGSLVRNLLLHHSLRSHLIKSSIDFPTGTKTTSRFLPSTLQIRHPLHSTTPALPNLPPESTIYTTLTMSSGPGAVSIANKGKASVWTEEAKVCPSGLRNSCSDSSLRNPSVLQYELLLRIVHHLKKDRSINWASIKMENRNTKSLTNQWTRIGKDIAALEGLDVETDGATSTPKRGSGKFFCCVDCRRAALGKLTRQTKSHEAQGRTEERG